MSDKEIEMPVKIHFHSDEEKDIFRQVVEKERRAYARKVLEGWLDRIIHGKGFDSFDLEDFQAEIDKLDKEIKG